MQRLPCPKDCPNRRPACQGSCQTYLAWAEERKKAKAWLNKYADADQLRANHVMKAREKRRK